MPKVTYAKPRKVPARWKLCFAEVEARVPFRGGEGKFRKDRPTNLCFLQDSPEKELSAEVRVVRCSPACSWQNLALLREEALVVRSEGEMSAAVAQGR